MSSTCFLGSGNRCNCWLLWLSRAVVIMWIYLIIRGYSSVLPAILLVTVCVHTCTCVSAIVCIVCIRRFQSDSPSWCYLKSLDRFVLGAPGVLPREGKKKTNNWRQDGRFGTLLGSFKKNQQMKNISRWWHRDSSYRKFLRNYWAVTFAFFSCKTSLKMIFFSLSFLGNLVCVEEGLL